METPLTHEHIKQIIFSELPKIVKKDPEIRRYILKVSKEKYADKEKTEDRIDRILDELKRDREASEKKWAESLKEDRRKWTEHLEESMRYREDQEKKWVENQKAMRRLESTVGAVGARWGLQSEAAFRDALKAILEKSFNVKVERYLGFDDKGVIFGRPDQVEMDVIIYNGTLILCEIKSSIDKSDVYIFWRKTLFYEERHQRKANRKIVISPMLSPKAIAVAKELNIETYGHADDVPVNTV